MPNPAAAQPTPASIPSAAAHHMAERAASRIGLSNRLNEKCRRAMRQSPLSRTRVALHVVTIASRMPAVKT